MRKKLPYRAPPNLNASKRPQNLLSRLRPTNWNLRTGLLMLALATLSTTQGCDEFSKPAGNPPLSEDLKTFAPLPQPTGDKGRDALKFAKALVEERALRKGVVAAYCRNANPC